MSICDTSTPVTNFLLDIAAFTPSASFACFTFCVEKIVFFFYHKGVLNLEISEFCKVL